MEKLFEGNFYAMNVAEKLRILGAAARYDVSCASSGSRRENGAGGIGNTVACGICHSFTDDGRCVSLLKIMMTNCCIYDCAYCINRRSNDVPRATFTVKEIVSLTLEFYRRNYIEGLFLSSGVIKSPDYTMSLLASVARTLRNEHRFNGYIHLKVIPGAAPELVREAGMYADRLSVNIEIPTEKHLMLLAPEKNYSAILSPMQSIRQNIIENREDRRKYRKAPRFVPAGQSTQLIVGASPEPDKTILSLASMLYSRHGLKRVYYSGYIPVNPSDSRLPALKEPPLLREHRLYQADWLLRFYHFSVDELVDEEHPNLETDIDPKLSYALRHPWLFPVDVNKADYETLLRVPGIGVRSARLIIAARKYRHLTSAHLQKIGVVMKRAKYFITCKELESKSILDIKPEKLKEQLLSESIRKRNVFNDAVQLTLF